MAKNNIEEDDSIVISEVKKQTQQGIVSIISRIFNVIFNPILNVIDTGIDRIKKRYEKYKTKREEAEVVFKFLLTEELNEKGLGMIAHFQHNGKKSNSGKSYKSVRCFYSNILPKNELMRRFIEHSQDAHIYTRWLKYCYEKRIFYKDDFDKQMRRYFTNDTKWILFRSYRDATFIICSEVVEPPDLKTEGELIELLDNVICSRKKLKKKLK